MSISQSDKINLQKKYVAKVVYDKGFGWLFRYSLILLCSLVVLAIFNQTSGAIPINIGVSFAIVFVIFGLFLFIVWSLIGKKAKEVEEKMNELNMSQEQFEKAIGFKK